MDLTQFVASLPPDAFSVLQIAVQRRINDQRDLLLRQGPTEQEKDAINAGRIVPIVKLLRERTGLDLITLKGVADRWLHKGYVQPGRSNLNSRMVPLSDLLRM